MSNFEDFLSWAKANPEGYAHCVAGLRRFIRSVEEKAGPDPIFTPRMADIELSQESLLSFSVESRMAALAVLEKCRDQFEENEKFDGPIADVMAAIAKVKGSARKIVIPECERCPYCYQTGAIGEVWYIPFCNKKKRELPWHRVSDRYGVVKARCEPGTPDWCPLPKDQEER